MSVRVMSWVWDQDIPTTKKMILLAIADHASDDGDNAWPSLSTLAKKVGIGERHVRRMLRELEHDGWLVTFKQRGGRADQEDASRPNLYRIVIHTGDIQTPTPRTPTPPPPRASTPPKPYIEPSVNLLAEDLFESVLDVCKIGHGSLTASGKGSAMKACKELAEVGATPADIEVVAKRYRAAYPNAQITPTALAKHYGTLIAVKSTTAPSRGLSEPCVRCNGTGWKHINVEEVGGATDVTRCDVCHGAGVA